MQDTSNRIFIIVLAGWVWSRLRPLSTSVYPKQFIPLEGDKSILQNTIERCQHIQHDVASICVSTNIVYQDLVKEQVETIGIEDIIVEPTKRNTAPAIALITRYLMEKKWAKDNDLILVCPSDHHISPAQRFAKYVQKSYEVAKEGKIILFWTQPDKPETGYGYIKIYENESPWKFSYQIEKFVEKPTYEKAKEYIASGSYFRNTGIFLFSVKTIQKELLLHIPVLWNALSLPYTSFLEKFSTFPDISIDYAVMEKTEKSVLIPMTLHRSDLWCRDSIRDQWQKDTMQNVVKGNITLHQAKNNLVISDRKVIVDSVDNLLIVENENGLYITSKGNSQNIKNLL